VNLERGIAGGIPYAAVGSGRSIVVAAGLWPSTGVDSEGLVRGALAPLRPLSRRRLIVLNRRAGLPADVTMSDLATEYADAIRALCDPPVDVMGASTGGSIVQQLAADHPAIVRRLVLLSTACRLGTMGRDVSSRAAALLRSGRTRSALGLVGMSLAPRGFRTLARAAAWAAAGRLIADSVGAADLASTGSGTFLSQCRRRGPKSTCSGDPAASRAALLTSTSPPPAAEHSRAATLTPLPYQSPSR